MSENTPGFANFMSNFRNEPGPPPMGSPPGPTDYQKMNPPQANFQEPNRPDIGFSRGQADFNDAVNMGNNTKFERREMKGPSDLNNLLSGLKTKKINIKAPDKDGSTISISELKEMQKTNLDGKKPKKTKRKKSERNTVELNFQ